MKNKGLLFILFLLIAAVNAYSAPPPPWESEEMLNRPAIDFTLKTLNGEAVTLSSLKGKVVLVNFVASWCVPCKNELPSINRLYNSLKDSGFDVLVVSVDKSEQDLRELLKSIPIDFKAVLDRGQQVARGKYRVYAYPMSYLIDKRGIIVKIYLGERDWTSDSIIKEIHTYLGAKL